MQTVLLTSHAKDFTHLDSIEYFIDELYSGVLVCHLSHLKPPAPRSQADIEWYHQQHHSKSSKDGRPHGEVKEDKREDDLERSRPEQMEVCHELSDVMSICRHQVDNLFH